MTNRMKLLAAVAAIALPAAMAGAQSTAPGGGNHRPTTHGTRRRRRRRRRPPTPRPRMLSRRRPASRHARHGELHADPAARGRDQPSRDPGPDPAARGNPLRPPRRRRPPRTPPATAAVRAATAADLHAGVQVHDQAGGVVGTVETADASGAVVSTGTVRARLPLASFGANGQGGLVISMTRGQLEAAASHAQPQPPAS